MSKRDIKAKRWVRRKVKRTYNLIRHNYLGYLKQGGAGVRAFIFARQNGKARLNRLVASIMTGNAGDGAGANGNMREIEALPVPDRNTSKPDLSTNIIDNIT